MPVRTFDGGGLRVRFPSTLDVRAERRTRNRSITPDSVDPDLIEDLLADGGFELVKPLTVRPRAARGVPRPGGDNERFDVEVSLRGDEQAVVLMDRGGYYSWHMPKPGVRALRGDGSATATIALDTRAPGGEHATRGLLDEIRAFVLRFSAPIIAGAAIKVLEAGVDEGLVHIASTDTKEWVPVDSLSAVNLPAGGSARILLIVHGTFSSTVGGFGSLTTDSGKEFLERALDAYDAIIGFDHRTLSVDPLTNARDLLEKLSVPHTDGAVVDVICHSRGGLVVRGLVEHLLPAANWSGSVNNIVFVGVPNAGTNFADAKRWSRLVDVYTNLLLTSAPLENEFLAKVIAGSAIKTVGILVKYLAAYAADDNGVPGLGAMRPNGDFIRKLNRKQPRQPEGEQPWLVISSDFHAAAGQAKLGVIEGIVDELLDKANDLVVDSKSMAAIDTPAGALVRETRDFGTNSAIYHTNYFAKAEVVASMQSWLLPTAAAGPLAPFDRDGGFGFDRDKQFKIDGGGGPPPPAAPRRAQAPRTRAHILAEMPRHVVVREPATVRVVLSRNKIKVSADAVSGEKTVMVDEDEALTVQIVPKRNAAVQGKDTKRFRLPLDDGLAELQFVVKPLSVGPVEVRAIVRRSPTDILATVTLVATADESDDAVHRQEVVRAQVEAAAATSIDLRDTVVLEISELERPGYVQYRYVLTLPGATESLRYLSGRLHDRAEYVANVFKDIETNWTELKDTPREFMNSLQEQGTDLFDRLFPAALRELLWEKRNALKSILLLADEPYFPWELVHLKPPDGPLRGKPRFLGQYGLLRWQILPFPEKPALRRRRGRVYSICPDYADPTLDLPEIAEEADFLKGKLGARAVRATPSGVREILRNPKVDILHFSGHGAAKPLEVGNARILLQGRDTGKRFAREYISAKTVGARARLNGDDGTGPLVVLNACQVGISGVELSSLGGFARAFLERGAQAFVSCLWSVQEQPSRIFVETLYERLIAGDSIGKAAVEARIAAHTPEDPATWLGFVIYARPDAKFVKR